MPNDDKNEVHHIGITAITEEVKRGIRQEQVDAFMDAQGIYDMPIVFAIVQLAGSGAIIAEAIARLTMMAPKG